jgi:hypothetical protein
MDIVDANMNQVSQVTLYGGSGVITSVQLSETTFVPEAGGALSIVANQGAQGQWSGVGTDNQTSLPNGYYYVLLRQAGQPPVKVAFWVEHKPYSAGMIVALTNPVSQGSLLNLWYNYPSSVRLEVRVYNVAGELVAQANAVGSGGVLPVDLRSASGFSVADGVYMVQVRGTTISGGVQFLKMIKVAVAR